MTNMYDFKIQSFPNAKFFLFPIVFFLFQLAFSQETGLEGYWVANIDQDGLKVKYEMQIDHQSGGTAEEYSGFSKVSDDFSSYGYGMDDIVKIGKKVSFHAAFGKFEGELSSDFKSLKGILLNPDGIEVEFKKTQGQIATLQFYTSDSDDGSGNFESDTFEGSDLYIDSDDLSVQDYTNGYSSPPPINEWLIYLVVGILIWLIFIVLLLYYLKVKNRNANEDYDITLTGRDSSWVSKIEPIIRIQKRRGLLTRDLGIVVHKESIAFFRKWRRTSIDSLYDAESDKTFLSVKSLARKRKYDYTDIESVEVTKPSKFGNVRLRIKAKSDNTTKLHKMILPYYETPNVLEMLKIAIGDRLKLNQKIKVHHIGRLVLIIIFSLVFFVVTPMMEASVTSTETNYSIPIGVVKILGLIIIHILILGLPMLFWISDHLPKKMKQKAPSVAKDLSDRRPFRSQWLSIILKLIAVVILILCVKNEINPFWIYLIIGNVLFVAHALAQRDPNKLRKNSNVKPILYLRSFLDDNETTLNPQTNFSTFIGIDPPYNFLDQYELNPRSTLYRTTKLLIRYVYNYHPFRLWKLFIGRPIDTSEQQLGNFLSRYGNFTAIGKPGEKIVTAGAARKYVGNDEWQQVVTGLMEESRFIVLQPSRTSGIWWEVEQVLKKVSPNKLLLCLVNYRGFQNDFEDFRLKLETFLPDSEISKGVGNDRKINFIHFDEKWKSIQEKLKYRFVLLWPIYGTATNLKSTLKPFLNKVEKKA